MAFDVKFWKSEILILCHRYENVYGERAMNIIALRSNFCIGYTFGMVSLIVKTTATLEP